eukprot:m.105802 g.105802  ORF g.105802 m.105802 type:complete len:67 (+) comp12661_c4_seq6:1-201(+)
MCILFQLFSFQLSALALLPIPLLLSATQYKFFTKTKASRDEWVRFTSTIASKQHGDMSFSRNNNNT